jgi:hypothetical protein
MLSREINPVPPGLIDTALVLLSASLGFLAQRYFASRKELRADAADLATEKKATLFRIAELETKLALVNAAVVPISTAFQAILIKELTHFHTPEMDALLVKVGPPVTLSEVEEARLTHMLQEREKDLGGEITDSERDAAHILPAIMKRARIEQELLSTAETLRIRLITVGAALGVPGLSVESETGGS